MNSCRWYIYVCMQKVVLFVVVFSLLKCNLPMIYMYPTKPQREKQRTLYMYNTMLRKRVYFLRYMRRRVKRKAKKMELKVGKKV